MNKYIKLGLGAAAIGLVVISPVSQYAWNQYQLFSIDQKVDVTRLRLNDSSQGIKGFWEGDVNPSDRRKLEKAIYGQTIAVIELLEQERKEVLDLQQDKNLEGCSDEMNSYMRHVKFRLLKQLGRGYDILVSDFPNPVFESEFAYLSSNAYSSAIECTDDKKAVSEIEERIEQLRRVQSRKQEDKGVEHLI